MIVWKTQKVSHVQNNEMKVDIIHTSRGRPDIAYDTVVSTLDGIKGDRNNFLYTLGIEESEKHLYMGVIKKLNKRFNLHQKPTLFTYITFKGKRVETSDILTPGWKWPKDMHNYLTANTKGNILCKNTTGDWIVTVADNLYLPEGWDVLMLPQLQALRGTTAIIGYPNQLSRSLISHPVLTPEWISWNDNVMMSNAYFHTHGDCELFLKATLSGTLHSFGNDLQPSRKHAYDGTAPLDDLCTLDNSVESYTQAETIWQIRKAAIIEHFSQQGEQQ